MPLKTNGRFSAWHFPAKVYSFNISILLYIGAAYG
jgi:hypothetical protein